MATGRTLWLNARTLEDLGELTAQWLEGRITFLPTYAAQTPAAETRGLIARLAAYNRAGYFTSESQPGVPLDEQGGQRAFVSGFASEATIDAVEAAILGTRLIALITPPGRDNPFRIPVTIMDEDPCTFIGTPLSRADIVDFYGDDCPLAVPTLVNTWQLDMFDPEWGDNELLWETLAGALK
ncbi:MAG TPA: hypothetical protein VFU73_13760 [Actinocrinis sp.]|nr:hypothetical protein [Actinocrinis sp.]